MTIVHGYLLGGLVLMGIPILVHLIMRQKPKVLPFPAFRFLKQRRQTNQRRLRLQHLLLLLLRMLLIALLCVALAMMGSRDQANLLVFDSSPSMSYRLGDQTRLTEARKGAFVLLESASRDSETAIFDTGTTAGTDAESVLLKNPSLVASRLESLQTAPPKESLLLQLQRASALLAEVGETSEQAPSLFLFSDFTRSSWAQVQEQQVELPKNAKVVLVDVGVEKPRDLAIDKIVVKPPIAIPGERIRIEVTVRAVGSDFNNELLCSFEREADPLAQPQRKQVTLSAGRTKTLVFERECPELPDNYPLAEMPIQVTAKLATTDALPMNNARYHTFLVRRPRKILVVTDDAVAARPWVVALEVMRIEHPAEAFECTTIKPADAAKLSQAELQKYKVVCLFQVANPPAVLWTQLARFVGEGGGLVIVPGGEEMEATLDEFNADGKNAKLLPATYEKLITVAEGKPGVPWVEFRGGHPITTQFRQWAKTTNPDFAHPQYRPMVNRYWEVFPLEVDRDLAQYDDAKKRPALLERRLGEGSVIQLTVPLDGRSLGDERTWHNYYKDSAFGLALIDQICRYLAEGASSPTLNYPCGTAIDVPVPSPAPKLPYVLNGPGLSASETSVQATEPGEETPLRVLALPQAVEPGNYTLLDVQNEPFAGFSLNDPATASDLERITVEEIETMLGREVVPVVAEGEEVPTGAISVEGVKDKLEEEVILLVRRPVELSDFLEGSEAPWKEAIPWLMMLLLLGMVLESYLANRFYRRPKSPDQADEGRA